MTAILSSIWPIVGSALIGLGGLIFGLFRHQQAKTATAEADKAKSDAAASVAQKQSQVDQANAAASAAGQQAVVNRAEADQTASATPREDIDAQLAALGALRSDK